MGLVEDTIARARAAWPSIFVDDAELRQCLLRAADEREEAVAELFAADLYLARACARGDPRAHAIFDRDYLARVPAYLARHRARALADEVRQCVRERVLIVRGGAPPRIADYSGRGPLASWLRVATLRVAADLTRRERPEVATDELAAGALVEAPELRVLETRYRGAFRAAFRAAFAALDPEDRSVLKLHFLEGVTVRKLAPLLGVSPATAGRRLIAAQRELGDAVIQALALAGDQSVAELESIVRALVSRLEISLSALLA